MCRCRRFMARLRMSRGEKREACNHRWTQIDTDKAHSSVCIRFHLWLLSLRVSRGKREHFLPLRVEADTPLLQIALIGQQRGLRGAMSDVDIGVRQLARPAALQKIAHVLNGD